MKFALFKKNLLAYEQDFSKHAPNEIVPKIRMLWNNIPSQLVKENKNLFMDLLEKELELKIMKLRLCGFLIVD